MCKRYGQRPSSALGMRNRIFALDFDLAMAAVHRAEDESRAEASGNPLAMLMLNS